ncbi:secretory carrier-associated membrane protein 3 isoform X2 [Lepisosteus oculatus]|uniref:secretory carrier-associated membrane protein 3 isoform X2 n=1 Tax=Lepisosteus oculatus TaxID=7918 RepID=UPI00371797B1
MSQYTRFPDPADDTNPFQDPAVAQHSSNTGYATLDLYNPFDSNTTTPPPYEAAQTTPTPPQPAQPPAKKSSPTEPRNYGSYSTQAPPPVAAAATAELLRKQEELERRAAELERRERALDSAGLGGAATRQNNWPPLPSFCPVQPCFYQDIAVEISQNFQRTVTAMYYFWIVSAGALQLNFLACLAHFCIDTAVGVDLGMSILWLLLFTPCSFLCWYRPLYKAFRSDSSFNFFLFFFIFFTQIVVYILMAIGIPNWGFSGWIVALSSVKKNVGAGVIMLLAAMVFTGQAVLGTVMLKRIHSLYRQTGASFQKAQAELASGVLSNDAVRQAAAQAAAGAAQGAAQGAFTGGR